VLAGHPAGGVLGKEVRHLVHAAFKRQQPAAAPDEDVDVLETDAVLGKRLFNGLTPKIELVLNRGEGGKLLHRVADFLGKDLALVLKQRDFRRRRAGVDG
jgi:hypothetical protein